MFDKKPFIDGGRVFMGGVMDDFKGDCTEVTSPIVDPDTHKRTVIGKLAHMKEEDVKNVITCAKKAWCNGTGEWPQMVANNRLQVIESVLADLKGRRDEIVHVLSWEIGKSTKDAYAEFDRTMKYIESSINDFRSLDSEEGQWRNESGYVAKVRRGPIGIVLNFGPFNYPFNETYATLIPALLSGNILILKVPSTGGLMHVLTMDIFAKYLPKGVLHFISGPGKELVEPLMRTGEIDALAFIGSYKAADSVIKTHPHPHRLRLFLQMESKNLGIVLPDADLDIAVKEIALGATSYNGQRCTAIKLVMVHKSVEKQFLDKFVDYVSQLKVGLPWEEEVVITPLAEPNKPQFLHELLEDAVGKGAQIVNARHGGGEVLENSIMRPAIVYPVSENMRLWQEEQFGPVIPIAVYEDIKEVMEYIVHAPYGQQASVFTSSARDSAPLLDVLATVVARVNINTQCSRSPDTLPFTGRRSSALGSLSVRNAIREFSIETVVAAKQDGLNERILKDFEKESAFLQPLSSGAEAMK